MVLVSHPLPPPTQLRWYLKVLLVMSVVCELQYSETGGSSNASVDDYDQRNMMKNLFRKALNDSKQLLTLQKAFLAPRPEEYFSNGLCLAVSVIVEGQVIDNTSDFYYYYCDDYFHDNNSCIYQTSVDFKLLVPSSNIISLEDFLSLYVITEALIAVDPSFYFLTSILSTNYYNYKEWGLLRSPTPCL